MSPAPAADVEATAAPPAVELKRQAVVSSSISSHVPATRVNPPVNPPVNNPASSRPPPDRTEVEDNDYDSDDASKTGFTSQTKPLCHRT